MKGKHLVRKSIYGLAWAFIVFAGLKIVASGFSDVGSRCWKAVSYSVTGAVLEMAAPASGYIVEERAETLAEFLMSSVRAAAPVWEYAGKKNAGGGSIQDSFDMHDFYAMAGRQGNEENRTEGDNQTERENQAAEARQWAEDNQVWEEEDFVIRTEKQGETEESVETVPAVEEGHIKLSEDVFHPEVIGTEYPLARLCDYDFLVQHFYAVSEITTITGEELNAQKLLEKNMSLQKNETAPQILIYHSHSQEEFCDSRPGVKEDTIVGVGSYLAELLTQQYGYMVYHDKTEYDVADGQLDRNNAYNYAAEGVEAILQEYPSIEVIIDLHRDGVDESVHLVTEVNGKPTAQIMFVNGISKTTLQGKIGYLENPYIEDNLAFSLKMQLRAEAYYPGFTRRIMIKAYRYNMHYRGRSLLVETGAQTNTLQEAKNAMEPLAVMLNEILTGG